MDRLESARDDITRVFIAQAEILQQNSELPAEFIMNITRYDFEGLFRAIGQTIDRAGGCDNGYDRGYDNGQIRDMINRLNKDFDFLYNQASTVQTDGE